MSNGMFQTKHMINKRPKSATEERPRAMTMNPSLPTASGLFTKSKQRSSSFSNAFHQVVGFVQRKLTRANSEENRRFSDVQE